MASLEYFRPKTLEEALSLLKKGVPLAGGTALTPVRHGLEAVIDLQDLGLDTLEVSPSELHFGATLPLQALVAAADRLPSPLVRACRLEAGWNIRNQATLGGSLFSGDGRSPLLTTLLAMGAELEWAQRDSWMELAELFQARTGGAPNGLVTAIHLPRPDRLAYEQVARSPADQPQVCAAAAFQSESGKWRIAIGGHGRHPLLVYDGGQSGSLEQAVEAARRGYSHAGDAWASAEFRAAVAATLVGRVVREVLPR